VQPCAAGRIRGRQLMAREAPHHHVDGQLPWHTRRGGRGERGGIALELCNRRRDRRLELLRQRLDTQFDALPTQHAEHEEVAAEKSVPTEADPLLT
jgi:hypothetical protein